MASMGCGWESDCKPADVADFGFDQQFKAQLSSLSDRCASTPLQALLLQQDSLAPKSATFGTLTSSAYAH
jgi:hypothetical protein